MSSGRCIWVICFDTHGSHSFQILRFNVTLVLRIVLFPPQTLNGGSVRSTKLVCSSLRAEDSRKFFAFRATNDVLTPFATRLRLSKLMSQSSQTLEDFDVFAFFC